MPSYKMGDCHVFAIALHDLTSWPLVAVTDHDNVHGGKLGGGSSLHWMVRHPSGKLLDVDGLHDPDAVVREYDDYADEGQAALAGATRAEALEWYRTSSSRVSLEEAKKDAEKRLAQLRARGEL